MVLLLVAVAVSVPILYYIPGATVMGLLRLQRERINLYSYLVSTLFYASVAILGHLLGVGQVTLMELVMGSTLIVCGVMLAKWIRSGAVIREAKALLFNQVILILVTGFVLRVLLSGLISDFWRGGDWYFFHYSTALVLSSNSWSISPDRTPLFSLICAMFMSVFGREFWVAQVVGDFLNTLFLIPSYYISKQTFGRNAAVSALVFLSVLPYFSYNAIYFWPKLFAAYFILLSFYELLAIIRRKPVNWPLYMLSVALAVLAHEYALLFGISGVIIGLVYRKLDYLGFLRGAICFSVIMLPWWLYNLTTFGSPIASSFKYYPFAVGGFAAIPPAVPSAEFYRRFFATPLSTLIWIRVNNLLFTFTPLLGLIEKYIAIPYLHQIAVATWGFEFVYQMYSVDTLFGALTISLSIFLLISLRHVHFNGTLKLIAGYVTISSILMTLDWGWFIRSELGFGIQGLFPAFTLLTIVSVARLERIGKDRAFVFLGSTFEMVLFYVFLLTTANSNPQEPVNVTLYYQFTEHWSLAFLVCLILVFYFCILAGYNAPLKTDFSRVRKVMDRTQQSRPDDDRPLNR
jgi:hypothetical protein